MMRLEKAQGDRPDSQIAAELTVRMGRHIAADTYRKWKSNSMLAHDAILPVCDIMHIHPYTLLGRVTEEERIEIRKRAKLLFMKPKKTAV